MGVEYHVGRKGWTFAVNGNRYVYKTKKEAVKQLKLKKVDDL